MFVSLTFYDITLLDYLDIHVSEVEKRAKSMCPFKVQYGHTFYPFMDVYVYISSSHRLKIPNKVVYLTLKIVFVLANSVNPD